MFAKGRKKFNKRKKFKLLKLTQDTRKNLVILDVKE